jgi:hypothetical protein
MDERDGAREARRLTQTEPSLLRTFTRQCGAYLALLALVLQLALSFGHLHARDISGPWFAKAHTANGWQQAASKAGEDDDLCPICISGFLLSTSFVPDTPQPAVPFAFEYIALLSTETIGPVANTRRAPFQPRAPPLA